MAILGLSLKCDLENEICLVLFRVIVFNVGSSSHSLCLKVWRRLCVSSVHRPFMFKRD